MRRDIFLHFLNRDTREIFGVYETLGEVAHSQQLRRAINAAAILCEDRCVAPPGFIVEDKIAFEIAESQQAYLDTGLLQFPMRENSLAEFAEKKRVGYEPMRDRYSGLFSDSRIGFLGDHASGIIRRQSRITEGILETWRAGPDSNAPIWLPAKRVLAANQVELVANIPNELHGRGTALTWSAMLPHFPPEAREPSVELRDALQNIYFAQYCSEFDLVVLSDVPHVIHDFRLKSGGRAYSYQRLSQYLDLFELRDLLLNAPAELIVELRKRPDFITFVDAFAAAADVTSSNTDLLFHAGRARESINYNWRSLQSRRLSLYDASPIEVDELASALREVSIKLTIELGITIREKKIMVDTQVASIPAPSLAPEVSTDPPLVLYVALEEELETLTKQLGLRKTANSPEAVGKLGNVDVHVICPRCMGRVAGAVAIANYLAKRRTLPKLILIVGIAGGFTENEVEVGQIVVVTKVVDLGIRKVVETTEGRESPNFRREDHNLNPALRNFLLSHDFDSNSWVNDACEELDWPKSRRPSIVTGKMTSADEVVSSNSWRKQLLEGDGGDKQLLGVEMEAGGVCAAANPWKVEVSMLRVVSDQADPSKSNDFWRPLGMKTLAMLLQRVPFAEVMKQV